MNNTNSNSSSSNTELFSSCQIGANILYKSIYDEKSFYFDLRVHALITLLFLLIVIAVHLYWSRKPEKPEKGKNSSANGQVQSICIKLMTLVQLILIIFDLTCIYPGFKDVVSPLLFAQRVIVWPIIWKITAASSSTVQEKKNIGIGLFLIWSFISLNILILNILSQVSISLGYGILELSTYLVQYVLSCLLAIIGIVEIANWINESTSTEFTETTKLLVNRNGNGHVTQYVEVEEERKQKTTPYRSSFQIIAPFLWPQGNLLLQFYILICLLLFIGGRITNTYVPIYSKYIVNSLLSTSNVVEGVGTTNTTTTTGVPHEKLGEATPRFPWDLILIFISLKIAQGGASGRFGLIPSISNILWQKVQQYTSKQLQVQFFEHLQNLSMRWHLEKQTGAVFRSTNRGSDGIVVILNYIVFQIAPVLFDVIIAIVYITTYFGGEMGLSVFLTIGIYFLAMLSMTRWRNRTNHQKNLAENSKDQFSYETLVNVETVKYCGNEEYQSRKFSELVSAYQKKEWKYIICYTFDEMIQPIIINAGLLAGSILCIQAILKGGLTPGDYVLFMNYMTQLFEPLSSFGVSFRLLQRSFVDMEVMMDIFRATLDVKDEDEAKDLKITQGASVEFKNVHFKYSEKRNEVLRGISFKIEGGKSLAIVGHSGGGKTSITRLLLRIYDLSGGQILIDGQDIKYVTQKSLRNAFGVVPQETSLFNQSLKDNVKFGRVDATDEEMFEAAKAACLEKTVLSFPQGYDTIVGERGMKLSGGEKQRLAIARALLRDPRLIILDEATSSLDTQTEEEIQTSLQLLCQNRTTIIVAHRLSTIVNAHQIIVLHRGLIHESGTHQELLRRDGLYTKMWKSQRKLNEQQVVELPLNRNGEISSESYGLT